MKITSKTDLFEHKFYFEYEGQKFRTDPDVYPEKITAYQKTAKDENEIELSNSHLSKAIAENQTITKAEYNA